MGKRMGPHTGHMPRVCSRIWFRICVCTHSMCQTEGCNDCTARHGRSFGWISLANLLFFASCLPSPSTDNMVDQTKVETSEAKANELEKKVKDAEMFSCDANMNNMSMANNMHTSWCNLNLRKSCTVEFPCHTHWPIGIVMKFRVTSVGLTWDDK